MAFSRFFTLLCMKCIILLRKNTRTYEYERTVRVQYTSANNNKNLIKNENASCVSFDQCAETWCGDLVTRNVCNI